MTASKIKFLLKPLVWFIFWGMTLIKVTAIIILVAITGKVNFYVIIYFGFLLFLLVAGLILEFLDYAATYLRHRANEEFMKNFAYDRGIEHPSIKPAKSNRVYDWLIKKLQWDKIDIKEFEQYGYSNWN